MDITVEHLIESRKLLDDRLASGERMLDIAQDLVDHLARQITTHFPELAESFPKEVGKLAKATVYRYLACCYGKPVAEITAGVKHFLTT